MKSIDEVTRLVWKETSVVHCPISFLEVLYEHCSATKFRREIFVVSNMETIVSV